MAKRVYVRRAYSVLAPAEASDEEAIRELPEGRVFRADIVSERSMKQHRAYWGLCTRIATMLRSMGHETADRDYVSDSFKCALDHCDLIPLSPRLQRLTGERYAVRVRSISFDKMDQAGFNRFMDRVIAFTVTELLPHVPTRDLRRLVEELLEEIEKDD